MIHYITNNSYDFGSDATPRILEMFHGKAGKTLGKSRDAIGCTGGLPPMSLTISSLMPNVILPMSNSNLVVESRIAQLLSSIIPTNRILPVNIEKIIDVNIQIHDINYLSLSTAMIASELYHSKSKRNTPPRTIDKLNVSYFEIVTNNYYLTSKKYDDLQCVKLVDHFPDDGDPSNYILVSQRFVDDEIIVSNRGLFLRSDIYHIVSPFLNKLFFGIKLLLVK